jgi:hypothetical protein
VKERLDLYEARASVGERVLTGGTPLSIMSCINA